MSFPRGGRLVRRSRARDFSVIARPAGAVSVSKTRAKKKKRNRLVKKPKVSGVASWYKLAAGGSGERETLLSSVDTR